VSDPAVVVVVIGCRSGGGWWCCGGREEKKQIARAAAAAAAAEHRRTADNNTRTRAKQPKNRSRKIARAYDRPLRNPCARCVTRKVTRVRRCPQAHEKYEKHHHNTISSRREYRARGRGLLVGVGVALTIDVGSSSAHVVELHQTCEDLARPGASRYSIRFDISSYLGTTITATRESLSRRRHHQSHNRHRHQSRRHRQSRHRRSNHWHRLDRPSTPRR